MNECDTIHYVSPEKSVYLYSEWLDNKLVNELNGMRAGDRNANELYILHMIGNHWYYDSHYSKDFKVYTPITTSRVIGQNDSINIVNSYDNVVLYTDYVLHCIIESLRNEKAIMIYLSDHGEALGENNQWLHASENDGIKKPASLVWYSDEYANSYPEKIESLRRNKAKHYRTDFLFHSIVSSARIETDILKHELNIFESLE